MGGTGYWPMSLSSSNIESTKIADLYDGDNIVDIPSQFWKENPITIDIEYSVEVENQIQVNSTIQISCSTPDSQIYYTLDNSTPDSSKSLYSNQFEVESGTTIKAIAIKSGYIDSDIAEYVVN